jgi:hypothetical protein
MSLNLSNLSSPMREDEPTSYVSKDTMILIFMPQSYSRFSKSKLKICIISINRLILQLEKQSFVFRKATLTVVLLCRVRGAVFFIVMLLWGLFVNYVFIWHKIPMSIWLLPWIGYLYNPRAYSYIEIRLNNTYFRTDINGYICIKPL